MEGDSAGRGGIAEEDGEQQSEKEAVAARALEKIGAGNGKDGARSVHAAAPAVLAELRCVARTAK